MKSSKRGFTLVELGIGIAIITVVGGIIGMNGYNLYQNSRDTVTMQDLRALSDATELYMVDTNGITPCFSPEVWEGSATAAGICANSGYDYVQGRLADNQSLDLDDIDGEAFTFDNILTPDYIKAIPTPARRGHTYFFTTGRPDTNAGSASFAYTARLGGPGAKDKVDANVSVLNTLGVTGFDNIDRAANCTVADIEFSGDGNALSLGTQSDGTTALVNNTTNAYTYYTVSQLSNNGGIPGALISGTTACDLWSTGKGLSAGNFTDTQSGAGNSVSVSVNAQN